MKIYAQEKLILVNVNSKYYITKRRIFEYYSGKSSAEVYAEKPFDLKILKADLDIYIKSDSEMQDISLRREYQREKIDFVERILRSLERRGFQIKNAIDWEKLCGGPV
jgi:hypothetical protein